MYSWISTLRAYSFSPSSLRSAKMPRSAFGGDVQEGVHLDRGVHHHVGVRQRRLEIQGELLVELVVILLLDLARLLAPDGGLAVDLFLRIADDRSGKG